MLQLLTRLPFNDALRSAVCVALEKYLDTQVQHRPAEGVDGFTYGNQFDLLREEAKINHELNGIRALSAAACQYQLRSCAILLQIVLSS